MSFPELYAVLVAVVLYTVFTLYTYRDLATDTLGRPLRLNYAGKLCYAIGALFWPLLMTLAIAAAIYHELRKC